LWYVAVFGAIIVVFAVVIFKTFETQRRTSIDNDLKDYAELLVTAVGGESADIDDLFDTMMDASRKKKSKFTTHTFLISSKDSIVFETDILANPKELLRGVESRSPLRHQEFLTTTVKGIEYRVFSKHIQHAQHHGFELLVLTSLQTLNESLDQFQTLLFIIIPVALLLAGGGGWFLARRALRPVHDISVAAAAISSASLEKRVPVGSSKDELSELASTFNAMIDRLYASFKSQQNFIADASHDLRTPLTVIQMELELLLFSSHMEDRTRSAVERSLIEVERLGSLASDLLFLARVDANQISIERTMFRVDELMVECIGQLKQVTEGKNISLQIDIREPVELRGDEMLIRRMLINLLDNAIKYSPYGSTIETAISSDDAKVRIAIQDHGSGISEMELSHIFKRFHRGETARTTRGSGLGLAIVQEITHTHNGRITVESKLNEGTRFEILLPL